MKKKRKGQRPKIRKKPDEVLEYGPVRMARFGRVTVMESRWDPAEFRRFRASLPTLQKECETSLKAHIATVVELVQKYDPLELLAALFVANSVTDPTTYTESSATGKEYEAEYVFSILAATPDHHLAWAPPEEGTIENLRLAIDRVYADVQRIILFEPDNAANLGLEEFRAQLFLRHLMVRGHSYQHHHVDLFRAIASPHDAFLMEQYGFTSEDMIGTFAAIEDQIQQRLNAVLAFFHEAKALQAETLAQVRAGAICLDGATSKDELRARIAAAIPEDRRMNVEAQYHRMHRNGRELLSVDMGDRRISGPVVHACACFPGDNATFLTGPFSGHPTADTIIWKKPILRLGDSFVCPSPVVLFRSSFEVLEGLLLHHKSYGERYRVARAAALERLAVQYLTALLPNSTVGRNLFYTTADGKRAETDAVIVFDRFAFVVEAKAGGLSLPARRGAPSRLRDDFGRIVEDAFKQGRRVWEYVMKADAAVFEDENGVPVLTLRKEDIDELFVINPTLAVMDPLGTQLRLAREKGLLSGDTFWPWCIFINDLRIVSEILHSPAEFVLFLQRRLAANGEPYAANDELDMLCKFLDDGLFHEPGEFKGVSRIGIHGYMDMLDRWYIGRPHGANVEKPQRAIPPQVRSLVMAIESTGKARRIAAAIRLTELDQEGLDAMETFLESNRKLSLADGKEHDLTLTFRRPFLRGLSIYVSQQGTFTGAALRHAAMRKHLTKAAEWLAVAVRADDGSADFMFVAEGELQPDLLARLESTCRDMVRRFVEREGRRPERNDPCPCTSGRKYKKCCGLRA